MIRETGVLRMRSNQLIDPSMGQEGNAWPSSK